MDASKVTHDLRATVTVDRDGIIHQWGEAATEVMCYAAGDTLGTSLDVIIPPALLFATTGISSLPTQPLN